MGLAYSEPHRLLKPHSVRAPGARSTFCTVAGGVWRQQQIDLRQLDHLMTAALVEPEPGTSYYITQSTLRPGSWSRTLSSVMLLNACWVDIDIDHPPENWAKLYRPPSGDPAGLAALLVEQIIDAGLPRPTYVVATGGGLAPKWLFREPLPVVARARWETVQTYLLNRLEQIAVAPGVRWPVDRSSSDAARVLRLVGTVNQRWGTPCWICWDGGDEYDFGWLADNVLPYTAAQLAEWRAQVARGKEWDANRSRATAAGFRVRRSVAPMPPAQIDIEEQISGEAARGLWVARFEFARAVIAARGGAPKNGRNNHFWPLATALAWSCGSVETRLRQDLARLHQDLFQAKGWTMDEALSSASSVLTRLNQPVGEGTGNYRFTRKRWLECLSITPDELKEYGHLLGTGTGAAPSPRNVGAMGLEPIRGLDYGDWLAETRSRQALGGAYAAMHRKTTHHEGAKQRAAEMKKEGRSQQEIAAELSVSQQTISRWLKS